MALFSMVTAVILRLLARYLYRMRQEDEERGPLLSSS